jgi:hypothetical protein
MKSQATREKVSKALAGRKFPATRGGNGKPLTKPQILLLKSLSDEWAPEYLVSHGGTRKEWPVGLRFDLACPVYRLAVECDGLSHNTLKVKARDAHKEALAKRVGWIILRFKNQNILENLPKVIMEINQKLQQLKTEKQSTQSMI